MDISLRLPMHAFMDIHLNIRGFLWISMHIDLLWILDPGIEYALSIKGRYTSVE